MRQVKRKPNSKAKNNPALLLAGVFGATGLLAGIGAYFLKGTAQQTLKLLAPPLIGGTTGYLASSAVTKDKQIHTISAVLGTTVGYVVGNYIEQKKESEACSGFSGLKLSCWWPSLFGTSVQGQTGLHQPTAYQRALLDQANEVSDV